MMIKICGITRREDAEAAVRHGATAVGFVFWPKSPRWIAPDVAADIVRTLPGDVITVGVFVDESIPTIRHVAATVGLRTVQLHGSEPVSHASAIGLPVLKALSIEQAGQIDEWPADTVILLDAIDPVARGGTGTCIEWPDAARIAHRRRVVLAGGLTPDNVADAVAAVGPFGVDVSSGVERSPGIKDEDKVRRFVTQAREAFERLRHGGAGRV